LWQMECTVVQKLSTGPVDSPISIGLKRFQLRYDPRSSHDRLASMQPRTFR
jgi:hypothetical protein